MLTHVKITYDLATQISEADLPALRSQILLLLKKFAPGPKPVRVQLCVCLAILAIQMQLWKDVLPTVVSTLGDDVASHACILDFLRVLPEEVTEGRKITLTVRCQCCGCLDFMVAPYCIETADRYRYLTWTMQEEDLAQRTTELLADNAEQVVQLLINYAQSSRECIPQPPSQIYHC